MFEERPQASWGARLAVSFLRAYKRWVSPLLPPACRFEPTCSVYVAEAVAEWGLARGFWLGLRRLARCHPFHPGGFDPVPRPTEREMGGEWKSGLS